MTCDYAAPAGPGSSGALVPGAGVAPSRRVFVGLVSGKDGRLGRSMRRRHDGRALAARKLCPGKPARRLVCLRRPRADDDVHTCGHPSRLWQGAPGPQAGHRDPLLAQRDLRWRHHEPAPGRPRCAAARMPSAPAGPRPPAMRTRHRAGFRRCPRPRSGHVPRSAASCSSLPPGLPDPRPGAPAPATGPPLRALLLIVDEVPVDLVAQASFQAAQRALVPPRRARRQAHSSPQLPAARRRRRATIHWAEPGIGHRSRPGRPHRTRALTPWTDTPGPRRFLRSTLRGRAARAWQQDSVGRAADLTRHCHCIVTERCFQVRNGELACPS